MSLYLFINEIQLSVTAEQMTSKLSGLKQQQIDFVHYFAELELSREGWPCLTWHHLPWLNWIHLEMAHHRTGKLVLATKSSPCGYLHKVA